MKPHVILMLLNERRSKTLLNNHRQCLRRLWLLVQTLLLDRWLLSFGGQIRDVQKTPVGA